MKTISKKTYTEALGEVADLLKVEVDDCKFVALLGSVREGEHIAGYSDLDILLILNVGMDGSVPMSVLQRLKKICNALSKKYKIKISFLTHTERDLEEYVDYEYLVHYSWGKVILGDQKKFKKYFNTLISNKKLSKKQLVRQMYLTITHARFNLVRRYVSINAFNTRSYPQELVKIFIDNILEIADWRLIANSIWSDSKKVIVKNILMVSKSRHRNVVKKAYQMRKNWNKVEVEKKDTEIFFKNALHFINDTVAELHKDL